MPALKVGYDGLFYFFSSLDLLVQAWVQQIYNPLVIKIMLAITYMGFSITFLILSALISVFLISKRKSLEAIFLNISLFSAWGLMWFLKNLFMRVRPEGEALTLAGGYSFPSGHSMLAIAFYGFLAAIIVSHYRNIRAWYAAIALYILIFLIGFSRVYLNVHYTSDVLSGFVFGSVCLIISIKGMRAIQRWFD